MSEPLSPLSSSQREIMEIIWDRGEASAFEVREVLGQERDIARETVRTLLTMDRDRDVVANCLIVLKEVEGAEALATKVRAEDRAKPACPPACLPDGSQRVRPLCCCCARRRLSTRC